MAGPRYSIIPTDAVLDRRLGHLAMHVLAVLGGHADNNGWCVVRLKTIAGAIGSDASKVSKAIGQLVELGYLRKRDRFGTNGQQLANLYQVSMDREPTVDDIDDGVEPCSDDVTPLSSGQAPLGSQDKPPLALRTSHSPTEKNDPSLERPFSPNREPRAKARSPASVSKRMKSDQQAKGTVGGSMIDALNEVFS